MVLNIFETGCELIPWQMCLCVWS